MLYTLVVTGALVLLGYIATPVLGGTFDWGGLQNYKRAWGLSAVATVAAYAQVAIWAVTNEMDGPLKLLIFLNCYAALWGWAYALLPPRPAGVVAVAAVVGTAGAAVALCAVVAHNTSNPRIIAAAAVLVWQHLIVDGVWWIGLRSVWSEISWASAGCFCCALSAGSLASVGSIGSVASVASLLSVLSTASVVSFNCVDGYFEVCW